MALLPKPSKGPPVVRPEPAKLLTMVAVSKTLRSEPNTPKSMKSPVGLSARLYA